MVKDMYGQNKGIRDAVEILEYIDKVCRQNHIKYMLLFSSLVSALETEDVAEWLQIVQIGMIYDEYEKLLRLLKSSKEKNGFYLITNDIDDTFCEQFSRVYKRSHIVLEGERKRDERFYDNFVNIFPIYEVAETEQEYEKVKKEYVRYYQYLSARAITPGTVKVKNFTQKIKSYYRYRHRNKYTVNGLNSYLKAMHKSGNKYAFIPTLTEQDGCVKLSNTYSEIEEIRFAGKSFCSIKDVQAWVDDYYGAEGVEGLRNMRKNVVLRQGTETLRRVQLVALDILVEFDRICRKYDIKYILAAGTLLGAVRHKGFIPWDDDIDVFMLYEEWLKFKEVYEREIDNEKFFVRTQETDEDDNLCFFQIKRNGTVFCREGRLKFNSHPGVFMDILPYYNGASNYIAHKLQEKICKFFKTVTWAHMGAQSERKILKRKYYEFLQKNISNKTSSRIFFKFANCFKKSQYLCYLYVIRNPYKHGINQRRFFEELTELEFENYLFFVPKDYKEFLEYTYSKDYMMYPSAKYQLNHHFPAHIDLGDLHLLS